jgi:copper transport protein
MTRRVLLAAVAGLACALVLPASAFAHAALVRTVPLGSKILPAPPPEVRLTYSEAVEPRFAIVSVTDAAGKQVTAGAPRRATTDSHTLVTPVEQHLPEGWYLVFWRVISADGHPVRGAFTFAIGPNAGPAPQFVLPSLRETASTPRLDFTRWLVFISFMVALGLFALRMFIARPLVRRVPGTSLRAVTVSFWIALVVALLATPVYVVVSTAQFALRSSFDLGAVIPLARDSSFGRGFLHLELVLALFGLAAAIALYVDRPDRPRRSIAELLAQTGAVLAGLAILVLPGAAGHAAQTSPRALTMTLDFVHLLAGSIWIGGLVGLVLLWQAVAGARRVPALALIVPRFSTVAFGSVMLILASGIWASVIHLPTFSSLWQTSYGKALVAKICLLGAAMLLGAVNLARTRPRLAAAGFDPALGPAAAGLLRRMVSGEVVLVAGAVFAAAILTNLAPPPKALAKAGGASARVGPGPVSKVVEKSGYRVAVRIQPNRAALPNTFGVDVTRDGRPVQGASVVARFDMLDMEMGEQAYRLKERAPGRFQRSVPALVMVGHWGVNFEVAPPGRPAFNVLIVDKASG